MNTRSSLRARLAKELQALDRGFAGRVLKRIEALTREPRPVGLPGLRLHPLKGTRSGSWSVSVSGNWRVTFRFSGKDAIDVDYEDYH